MWSVSCRTRHIGFYWTQWCLSLKRVRTTSCWTWVSCFAWIHDSRMSDFTDSTTESLMHCTLSLTVLKCVPCQRVSFNSTTASFPWGHDPCALVCKIRSSSDRCWTSLSVSLSLSNHIRTIDILPFLHSSRKEDHIKEISFSTVVFFHSSYSIKSLTSFKKTVKVRVLSGHITPSEFIETQNHVWSISSMTSDKERLFISHTILICVLLISRLL